MTPNTNVRNVLVCIITFNIFSKITPLKPFLFNLYNYPPIIIRHNFKVLHMIYTQLNWYIMDCSCEGMMELNEPLIDIKRHIWTTVTHDRTLQYLKIKTGIKSKIQSIIFNWNPQHWNYHGCCIFASADSLFYIIMICFYCL